VARSKMVPQNLKAASTQSLFQGNFRLQGMENCVSGRHTTVRTRKRGNAPAIALTSAVGVRKLQFNAKTNRYALVRADLVGNCVQTARAESPTPGVLGVIKC